MLLRWLRLERASEQASGGGNRASRDHSLLQFVIHESPTSTKEKSSTSCC